MASYQITADLFTLEYKEGERILYAPLLGFACIVNEDLVDLLAVLHTVEASTLKPQEKAVIDYLIGKGIINGEMISEPVRRSNGKLKPTKLTLFPTNQCDMRCIYCYASSGALHPIRMEWQTAKGAVDYFISLMKEENRTIFPMEFHGGGEPFRAWTLVKHIVEYAEERCESEGFELQAFAGTNGVLEEKRLDWLVRHFTALNISFEGLPHVQDRQRPMANGGSSFESVNRTLKYLDAQQFPYGIRCTVTALNENLLPETIDFLTENYQTRLIYLEPVYLCERYKIREMQLKPDLSEFVENYKRLEPVCIERGVRLGYSGIPFERISSTFCYVGTDDFAVTPDGFLTNCWEVSSHDHRLAETFIFGRMLPEGRIEVDEEKVEFLRSLSVTSMAFCQDCFAKWHCAGDCVVKTKSADVLGPRGGERCRTTRMLIRHRIMQLLEREAYYEEERVEDRVEDEK